MDESSERTTMLTFLIPLESSREDPHIFKLPEQVVLTQKADRHPWDRRERESGHSSHPPSCYRVQESHFSKRLFTKGVSRVRL